MAAVAVNKKLARKVLALVDQGLVNGLGEPEPGKMCVEAVICYAMNLPHSDNPPCVSRAVRALNARLNDYAWSSNEARAKGMRRLAIAQLGSDAAIDDKAFVKAVAEMTIRVMLPIALRAAAKVKGNSKHKQALERAADVCEKEGTPASALDAKKAAAAYAAAPAYAYAAAVAAAYAYADAPAAAYAYAAAAAYTDAARNEVLARFADGVVEILIKLGSLGCKWLDIVH